MIELHGNIRHVFTFRGKNQKLTLHVDVQSSLGLWIGNKLVTCDGIMHLLCLIPV